MKTFETLNDCLSDRETFDILYEKYYRQMPYGTAKARDGEPDTWICDFACAHPEEFTEFLEGIGVSIKESLV